MAMKKVTTLAKEHDTIMREFTDLLADMFKDYLGIDPENIDMNDVNSFNTGVIKDWGALDMHPEMLDQGKQLGMIMVMVSNHEREKCLALDKINRKLDKIIGLLSEEKGR